VVKRNKENKKNAGGEFIYLLVIDK